MTDQNLSGLSHPPGSTIGMLGGGQLGRMFTMAARRMGYRVAVLTDDPDGPAATWADTTICGGYDEVHLDHLARVCDVVTLEFENIPTSAVQHIASIVPTYPNALVLGIAQDRSREKQTLRDLGFPVTPFRTIEDPSSPQGQEALANAGEQLGFPLILKTSRSGYDGKGQVRIDSSDALNSKLASFGNQQIVAEQCIDFDKEISVIVARNFRGETAVFPVFENQHVNHILDVTHCPANLSSTLIERAERLGISIAERLGLVGILCIEWFVTKSEELMINELAPRPHNSGHLTIEATGVSQFEQHVRAVCGLPLGDTALKRPAAMANLLGDLWSEDAPDFVHAMEIPGVCLHLYGKQQAHQGRKMGHLTAVAKSAADAVQRVTEARRRMHR